MCVRVCIPVHVTICPYVCVSVYVLTPNSRCNSSWDIVKRSLNACILVHGNSEIFLIIFYLWNFFSTNPLHPPSKFPSGLNVWNIFDMRM